LPASSAIWDAASARSSAAGGGPSARRLVEKVGHRRSRFRQAIRRRRARPRRRAVDHRRGRGRPDSPGGISPRSSSPIGPSRRVRPRGSSEIPRSPFPLRALLDVAGRRIVVAGQRLRMAARCASPYRSRSAIQFSMHTSICVSLRSYLPWLYSLYIATLVNCRCPGGWSMSETSRGTDRQYGARSR
jgi:hypothetical protein